VSDRRDYVAWHGAYDDPESGLSWRLRTVQAYIRQALDGHPGAMRVLSVCSGDGRDVLEILAGRGDSARVEVVLLELHPDLAQAARDAAAGAGLTTVEVRTVDAGDTGSYSGAVPADLVLLVGIFGNISPADIERTIRAAPQLCRAGATLLWSRGRDGDDLNDEIRAWFAESGFAELAYATREDAGKPALGAMRYDGEAEALVPDRRLFTFLR
jgi:hypothetical protein